jgi:hypothetical protein
MRERQLNGRDLFTTTSPFGRLPPVRAPAAIDAIVCSEAGPSQLIKNVRDISATVNYADDLDDAGALVIENQIVIVREQP